MDFFYYQLSKLHQGEAKTLQFTSRASFLTLSYCYGEIDENSSGLGALQPPMVAQRKAKTGRNRVPCQVWASEMRWDTPIYFPTLP